MGTKTYDNYNDLITFSRASTASAFAKISYGDELVTNGTFDSDFTGWTVGNDPTAVVVSGEATYGRQAGISDAYINQVITTEANAYYEINFDITAKTGTVFFSVREEGVTLKNYTSISVGSHTVYATANDAGFHLRFVNRTEGEYITIDNISMRKVLYDQADGTVQLFTNHPVDKPRIEYDSDGNILGLLVEEARTNIQYYSNTSAQWAPLGCTIDQDSAYGAPTYPNLTKLQISTASTTHMVFEYPMAHDQTDNTCASCVVKAGNHRYVFMRVKGSNYHYVTVIFDLNDGTITQSTAESDYTLVDSGSIELGDGLWRLWFTYNHLTYTSQASVLTVGFSPSATPSLYAPQGTPTYTADNNVDYFYVGFLQQEKGLFPSSYIPTTSTTVTRSADVASIATSAFGYNDEGVGTLFVEVKELANSSAQAVITMSDNSASNRVKILESATNWNMLIRKGGANQAAQSIGAQTGASTKLSLGFAEHNVRGALNGTLCAKDSVALMPPNLTDFNIGAAFDETAQLNGHIKSITYYPRRLSDAQLQELTT